MGAHSDEKNLAPRQSSADTHGVSQESKLPKGDASQSGAAPSDADLELPIRGFQGTPEEIERQWFEKIYTGRGDSQKQLTFRAVMMGGVLGMFMSISNLYTTLKLGWSFGVAITACVLSFVIWNALRAVTGGWCWFLRLKLERMALAKLLPAFSPAERAQFLSTHRQILPARCSAAPKQKKWRASQSIAI